MSNLQERLPTAPTWFFECELCQLWHSQCPQHLENCAEAAKKYGQDLWSVAGPFFARFHFSDGHRHYWPGTRPAAVRFPNRYTARRSEEPAAVVVAAAVVEESEQSRGKPIPKYLLDDYVRARRAQRREFWKKKSSA